MEVRFSVVMDRARPNRPPNRMIGPRPKKGMSGSICCFVSTEEKREITDAASLLGVSATRFVARAAIRDAESVVLGARATGGIAARGKAEAGRLSLSLTATERRILTETREGEREGKVTVTRIAARLDVDLAMATRLTRRLEDLRLLNRRRDAKDRRCLVLTLTAQGREALDKWERELRP